MRTDAMLVHTIVDNSVNVFEEQKLKLPAVCNLLLEPFVVMAPPKDSPGLFTGWHDCNRVRTPSPPLRLGSIFHVQCKDYVALADATSFRL